MYFFEIHASVVKLADALDSGSSGSDPMQVQVLSLAPCDTPIAIRTPMVGQQ